MLYRIPDDKDNGRFDNLNLTEHEVKHMTYVITIVALCVCITILSYGTFLSFDKKKKEIDRNLVAFTFKIARYAASFVITISQIFIK